MDSKTLRLVAIGGALVLAAVAGIFFMMRDDTKVAPRKVIKRDLSKKVSTVYNPPVTTSAPEMRVPLRDVDKEILALVAQATPDPSLTPEDLLPKSPAKVTMGRYSPADGGGVRVVEMDLNRDGRVDEQWRISKDKVVIREVGIERSDYRDVWVLEGEFWRLRQGDGATAMLAPRVDEKISLRPVDKQILAVAAKPAEEVNAVDALPGPVQVKLQRGIRSKVQKLQVDLDRDGKPDELWTLVGRVSRKVSPADDGNYNEEYELQTDHWVRVY